MEPSQIREVKKLAILALFSDEILTEQLVLKGGNLVDIVYNVAQRSSIDLDFSLEREFQGGQLEEIRSSMESSLQRGLEPHGYRVFDVKLEERPEHVTPDMADIWGGYRAEFKVIDRVRYESLRDDIRALRRYAAVVGPRQSKKITVDFSKFEYCEQKIERNLGGRTVYVYSPVMLVAEKLRAICQQLPEYAEVVNNPTRSARARDFFDIHTLCEAFPIDLSTDENLALLKRIFEAKRVPVEFLRKITEFREYHRSDFESLGDTVKPGHVLKSFDFYFDYVVDLCRQLDALWEV